MKSKVIDNFFAQNYAEAVKGAHSRTRETWEQVLVNNYKQTPHAARHIAFYLKHPSEGALLVAKAARHKQY